MITLPYLLVDAGRGTDTVVRLANTSDQPLRARCAYEATTPTCSEGGAADSCLPGGSGCAGDCLPNRNVLTFNLSLAAQQPLAWRIGFGLSQAAFPPLETVEVPAVGSAFLGMLRCAAVDAVGRPVDRNALVATAGIETVQPARRIRPRTTSTRRSTMRSASPQCPARSVAMPFSCSAMRPSTRPAARC